MAGRAAESDGKSENSRRVISLDPLTVAALRRHIAAIDEERQAWGESYPDHGLLAVYPDGRPMHPETITARSNRLGDQAGLPRIRLHDVQHSYATVSLDAGVNPKIVSERIGHASLAFTLQTYIHRSEGRDRDAAAAVASLFVPKPGEAVDDREDQVEEGEAEREGDRRE